MGIMNPIAKIIGGGVIGASAVGAYNHFEGRRGGAGEGFKMGAIAAAGLLLTRKGNFKATSNFAKDLAGKIPKGVTNTIGGWSSSAQDMALRAANKYADAFGGRVGNYSMAIGRAAFGAVPGAVYGAAGGAVYGAFSDRESMMSGAFKGALLGASIGAGRQLYSLNRGKKLANIMRAKSNSAPKFTAWDINSSATRNRAHSYYSKLYNDLSSKPGFKRTATEKIDILEAKRRMEKFA